MFPYRRNGGKKRGKGGPPGPHHQQQPSTGIATKAGGGLHGRRVPGSAGEVLSMLQPTTKALAQMLAGNARVSGQLAHARNVMVHAHRLVEERAVDRLPPAAARGVPRAAGAAEADAHGRRGGGRGRRVRAPAEPRSAAAELGPDRLREVARRLR
jgi:hypothetical protein